MKVKALITPLLIIVLSFAFITVIVGVYLTKGKARFWISKKMLIGSLLLSLTSVINQSCNVGNSCYDPNVPNQISMDNSDNTGIIQIDKKTGNKLTGILYDRSGQEFSFNIKDTLNSDTLQIGRIIPLDGAFNESTEEVFIELDSNVLISECILNLYDRKESEQLSPVATYQLKIKNED